MGVGTKKMAKSVAAAADDNSFGGRIRSWPERIKTYYNDVRTEMKKVTAPGWKEVQSTTVVVIISVFLFAAFFEVVDLILSHSLDVMLRYLAHRGG
jgi:preprotein translocase subunit SecE